MNQKQIFSIIGIFAFLVIFVFIADRCSNKKKSSTSGDITVLTWNDLYEHDYKTNQTPKKLREAHNSKVRIAGYVVPLTDDYFVLSEFLLVPNAQACIHVPPPPPNLIIHVKLDDPLPIEKVYNPAWIEGTFEVETTTSIYGDASFKMDDASLEEYKY